ncbi:hypothetical protein HHL16_21695 [Pseudoflavitalea sp. G-6-1-2]|uniref:TFIIB-type zinc ribbon-containing protein n=1 Tax=Pseudoflavitalea sp. G-6-1-2 TaxID=2728841 RepID=UPI00146C6411|nr:zf-TFIIB domain-containing protein [Pseudoflavitalea sp. G-6-1-2]NML23509.1 hypothetical protein [Pseudoflavitalea sp. G-6-1-2]
MKCPNCNETLLMTERNKIEIDYCPACRGIWLDKGELDKMLEYAEQQQKQVQQPGQNGQHHYPDHKKEHYKYDQYKQDPNYHKHKKKGFLGDLFDFD